MKNPKPQGFVKPLDFVAAAGVLLAALLAALPIIFAGSGRDAVILYEGGQLVAPLDENREYQVISHGYKLTIEIADGAVSVVSSDCPDKLCANTPPIRRAGMSIICVPARLIIYIEGDSDADAVAG